MSYTLHQLQIFHKVVELGSMTKASEALHLSQPAVSIHLKNLQSQFDKPLFEILVRKVYVTDFGYEIAKHIESIIQEIDQIEKRRFTSNEELVGKLKVSIVSTAKYIMPYFLSDFAKKHPEVELNLEITNRQAVVGSLVNNKVDFSMVSVLPDLAVESMPLMSNNLYLIGPGDTKLTKQTYDEDILRELPMIYREKGSGTRHIMESFIKRKKIPIKIKMELASNEAVKQAVLAGLGYSILPLIGIQNELYTGKLKIIPLNDFPISSRWHLIWLKEKKFSTVAQTYLEFIAEEIPQIIKSHFNNLKI